MSLQKSETVQPGASTGRVHWLVAMNRRNRSMAFALLWPAMAAQMRGFDTVGPLAWTLLTLQLLVLPQLMYWRARRAAQPRETEVGHMYLDALCFGLWSGWLGHPLWITATTLVCITANLMAFRGPRGALLSLGLYLAGAALMTFGLAIPPVLETDEIATLLSLLTLEVYLLGFAYGAYQRSMLLHRTRGELQQRLDQIAALQERLTEQVRRDPLTGLHNRHFLTERVHELTHNGSGAGMSIGVMLVDIDHFKQVNDRHGHQAGDRVLQAVARLLVLAHEEGAEVVCRYGGEEFLLLLPDRGAARMRALAERLRGGVEALRIETGRDASGASESSDAQIAVTLSIGWACGHGEPIERLIDRADRALYRAKQAGRNRVESALG
jgi:diguanylate cyclase (GGDEF)-like protein